MFKMFAELIAFHVEATERVASSEARLLGELQASELREQFIAVLGHDLRNPLAAIGASAELLTRSSLDAKASRVVNLIQKSVSRMSGLIDDVMDFARGRLGGGLTLELSPPVDIAPVLRQVIAELRAVWPDRPIEENLSVPHPVRCDQQRIGQLFSNLLANALTHGSPGHPVRVRATTDADTFELSVSNAGEVIPPGTLARLFQPFERGAVRPSERGLGLGLYIASEIARAHGGTIKAESSSEETRFSFQMPLR
jgi:signal transduction histidine kinase